MKYDFDSLTDRKGTYSLKWNTGNEQELPMWVADMDFATAPEIVDAICKRASHGIFGYSYVPDTWRNAFSSWWKLNHNYEIDPQWLVFATGVVPAISSLVRKMTTIGDNVLVQTPVYNIFFNSIVNNGRHILESPLIYDGTNYHIDYADLEEKLSDSQTTMMLLCNPHNPIGRIWDMQTLAQIGELCWKHHVLVVSDEIHCDLTDPGLSYIPFSSVSAHCADNSITCLSATKAFNMAGLQAAAIMVPNVQLRQKAERGLNTDEVAEPNAFAVDATIAAFSEGRPWLLELQNYIYANKKMVSEFLEKELPTVHLVPSQATYLLWLDCSRIGVSSGKLAESIRSSTGLWLAAGYEYGHCGDAFLRMNIATQRSRVADGLARLKKGMDRITDKSI